MKISARGWSRNRVGSHVLLDEALPSVGSSEKPPDYFSYGKTHAYRNTANDMINIQWGCEAALSGRFLMTLKLDKREILRMFMALYWETP
jgi:hypothetical protein